MKIKPSKFKITTLFIIGTLIIGIIIFLCLFSFFISPWSYGQVIVTSCYVVGAIILYILTIKTTYYIVDKKHLIFYRWGKPLYYLYDDIIYIEPKKESNVTISMFTNRGKYIFLTGDKENKIYNALISKCKNVKTSEEIKKEFPNAKI